MTHFASLVKPDLTMLSSVLQEQVIRKFLPSELIPAGWSCQQRSLLENVQSLYETSNKRIQMYGSPESLEKTLVIFMSFPGNQQFFQLKDYDVYKTYLPIYKSLGGNAYFYKKEMYELLIHHTPKFNTLALLQRLAYNLISFYLRTLKNKLATTHEMIGFDINLMQILVVKNLKFETMMERGDWKTYPTTFPFVPKNSGQVLNYISDLLVQCETGVKMGSGLRKKISMVTDNVPVEENGVEYKKMLTWLDITLQYFNTIIINNKMMFLARSETVDSIPASKIPIRLFESNEERVVMSHELLHAIKLEKLDVSGFEDRIMAMPKLSALSFREVFQMIPSDIFKMLEFVRIPQPPLLRDLRMIPTIDGNNCLTTWQFFLMIFDDAILIKRLFQGMKSDQWSPIMAEFYTMLMDTLQLESYFVTYNTYERIKLYFGTWFKKNFPTPNQKEISDVHKNGFTSEDLKNQLDRLELSEIFPGIENNVDESLVNPPTKGCPYEATKQMLDRVQDCQLAYILDGLPNHLIKILHQRKWCGRVLSEPCPLCSKKQGEPSVEIKEDSEVSVESKTVQEKESIAATVANSPDASSSDESLKPSSTKNPDDSDSDNLFSSATVESVVVEKPKSVRKPKKTKKNHVKPADSPAVKESQSCPKCIRASEYTVKTNEKLRLSKIEVKHLRKELSEVQLALEEKEERIRILEEKLREKESQLTLKNSEVESLNTAKQELDLNNQQNEKLIATFQEAISKKDLTIMFWQSRDHEEDRMIKELKAEGFKAIPPRSTEESGKVNTLLSSLLGTKTILSKEDPIKKSNEICDALVSKTNSKITQQFVQYETRVFQLQVSYYIQTVENNTKLIQGNQLIKSDQIPEIPDFPEFSEEFKNFHKFILKKEAPLLCRQLLNLTDEIADMECVVCINEMESHDDTTKCDHCKRRYHNHCIKSWLKNKSICPTCKHGMVDEQEFPAL